MFNPTFVGRMTADPVLRTAAITNPTTGEVVQTPVLNFRVAVDDGFRKDAEGKKIGTEFFECAVFRGAAETIAKYGYKGRVVAIRGSVHHREWFDSQTGVKNFTMTVPNVEAYEFFGPSPAAQKEAAAEEAPANVIAEAPVPEADPATPWD